MKNIYTFGRKPAQRNYTVADLSALKGSGKRLTGAVRLMIANIRLMGAIEIYTLNN
ncbi:hypothetical protein N9F04_04665 [Ascidiaceihabitans sp.]|nr:hypothetical protein [Ascidiaceihabitans sp.]